MGLMRPGDKLSRGISAANLVMLSLDGARELRKMLDQALAEHADGAPEALRQASIDATGKAPRIMAAQFEIDNLRVVVYDDNTDPEDVAEHMAKRTIADALQVMASLKQDVANSPIGRTAPLN